MFDIDWEWVENHLQDDPASLLLKFGTARKNEILQIDCRRRTNKKLSETLHTPEFIFPSLLASQQCSSDATARFHATLIEDGDKVLDMTSGLGIDDFHIARKASWVCAFDIKEENTLVSIHNARRMGINNIEFHTGDSAEWLRDTDITYDVVFIDPSRRDANNRRCYGLESCSPDVLKLLPFLKSRTKKLIVKVSPMLDISALLNQIPQATEIYAVGTEKECKELVIIADFTSPKKPTISAATIIDSDISILRIPSVELKPVVNLADPQEEGYICQPYPALMKIDAVRFLSDKYGISQIATNTHLLVSDKLIFDFPGKVFKVLQIFKYDKKTINTFRNLYPVINITTRNFPYQTSRLASVLGIKEGGTMRLFAVTYYDGSRRLIVTEPVC